MVLLTRPDRRLPVQKMRFHPHAKFVAVFCTSVVLFGMLLSTMLNLQKDCLSALRTKVARSKQLAEFKEFLVASLMKNLFRISL